ncbi:M15 family metallopeptidase [Roseivirga sp. E12]|uniref:M15 family metallopeptidase n=1 Tax=Roseivirga sp. E12 TaxID=2819237 RepID=UPI001ABC4597|nr:M15 family metallopeptidase [Roseivirga sp. E12]MBO3697894.1 D-alanyl-D-alanine carboxypeptidase family protein [Roseivirga sp. E12]
MNAQEYCAYVDRQDLLHKQLEPVFPIKENNERLVSLKDSGFNLIFEPSIMKDYRYLVRKALVEKIGRISKALDKQNKTLIIRSAWRSFEHQRKLWNNKLTFLKEEHPEKSLVQLRELVAHFIAPEQKSTHATGGALDALIYDRKTETVLDFGTNKGHDIDLTELCYPHHPDISAEARENRNLLMRLFEREGFVCDLKEYWHFDYGNVGWAIERSRLHAIYGIINAKKDI